MKKRIISLLLSIALFVSLVPIKVYSVDTPTFSDTLGHWAETQIEKWADYGVLGGFPDGTFRPDEPLTRAQFAKVIDSIMKYQYMDSNIFSDVKSDDWFYDVILKVSSAGVLKGSDSKAEPNKSITRYEAAVLITRAFNLSPSLNFESSFADKAEFPDWAESAVLALEEGKYISGKGDGRFEGSSTLTRAEAVTIVNGIVSELITKAGTYKNGGSGSVVINTAGVTLKDCEVGTNLYITEGVASGDVTIENVTVDNDIYIKGGGINTVHLKKVNARRIHAERKADRVRVKFENVTTTENVSIGRNVIVDGELSNAELVESNSAVDVKGKVNNLKVKGDNVSLNVDGSVNNLDIEGGNAKVNGSGSISKANINGRGANLSFYPESTNVGANVSATISGTTVEGGTSGKTVPKPTPPSSGGTGTVRPIGPRLSTDATLNSLTVSSGTLNPAFNSAVTDYNVTVSNDVTSIKVNAVANSDKATISVNGSSVASGNDSHDIELNVGSNVIRIEVTAQKGNINVYTITVVREGSGLSSNANLASLELSEGTLSPAFDKDHDEYTVHVSNTTYVIKITPTAESSSVKDIKINDISVASGQQSDDIPLNVGSNEIIIVVTAEDDTTKTYKITVFRESTELSSNANLESLVLSAGELSPKFGEAQDDIYTAEVDNSVASIDITPTAADPKIKGITVNGTSVQSGNKITINLVEGVNTVTIIVTAENDTTKTYRIDITRKAPLSSNADLSSLTISARTLDFKPDVVSYQVEVGYTVASIDVTPTAADSKIQGIKINGNDVQSGSTFTVSLAEGKNNITIVVTAENGSTKTYTIEITKLSAPSSDADLSSLAISAGSLTPDFDSKQENYTVEVEGYISSIEVIPTAADTNIKGIKINESDVQSGASVTINLNIGENTISVVVTAEDGITTKTYTIIVTRKQPNLLGITHAPKSSVSNAETLEIVANVTEKVDSDNNVNLYIRYANGTYETIPMEKVSSGAAENGYAQNIWKAAVPNRYMIYNGDIEYYIEAVNKSVAADRVSSGTANEPNKTTVTGNPLFVITEIIPDTAGEDVYEFIEVVNVSNETLDLNDFRLQIRANDSWGENKLYFLDNQAPNNAGKIEPGEVAVIHIYNAQTAGTDLRWDTPQNRYLDYLAFCENYKLAQGLIKEKNFAIAPCRESGKPSPKMPGTNNLANDEKINGVQLLDKSGNVVAQVYFNDGTNKHTVVGKGINYVYYPDCYKDTLAVYREKGLINSVASIYIGVDDPTPGTILDGQLRNSEDNTVPYIAFNNYSGRTKADKTVFINVIDDNPLGAWMYYKANTDSNYTKVAMTRDNEVYIADIPSTVMNKGTQVSVYFEATDGINKSTSKTYNIIDLNKGPKITSITPTYIHSYIDTRRPEIKASYSSDSSIDTSSVKLLLDGIDVTKAATVTSTGITYKPSTDLSFGGHHVELFVKDSNAEIVYDTDFIISDGVTLNHYVGEIHAHTSLSDGVGTPEDAYTYARDVGKVDFFGLTDHSHHAGFKTAATNGSYFSAAESFNESGRYVTLPGYEWTSNHECGWFGHINIYNTDYSDTGWIEFRRNVLLSDIYTMLKKYPTAFAQFNHPGYSWGNFMKYDLWDPEIDKIVRTADIKGKGYDLQYHLALDKGWHISPLNSEDNHEANWTTATKATGVIMAPSLTRENIVEAIRLNRTYSTDDPKLRIDYRINGQVMGARLQNATELNFNIKITHPNEAIGTVSILVDGGVVIKSQNFNTNIAEWNFTLPAEYKYYVVKVLQPDNNYATSAPIWNENTKPIKINKLDYAFTSNDINVKLNLQNVGSENLKNVKVEFYDVNDITGTSLKTENLGSLPTGDISIPLGADVVNKTLLVKVSGTGETTGRSYSTVEHIYISGLVLSEILFTPESGKQTYIEIYNASNKEINLKGYHIDYWTTAGSEPVELSRSGKVDSRYEFDRDIILKPGETHVAIYNNPSNTTAEQRLAKFNADYGVSLTLDQVSFVGYTMWTKGTNMIELDMSDNTTVSRIMIDEYAGEVYAISPDPDEYEGRSVIYAYPTGQMPDMIKTANNQPPTPGSVDRSLFPKWDN